MRVRRHFALFALGGLALIAPISAQFLTPAAMPQPSLTDLMIQVRSMEQPQPSARKITLPAGNPLELLHVLGNIYMVAGGPTNVAVQVGPDGVLVVDTAGEELAPKVVEAIRVLSSGPIGFVINTTPDKEYYGGNRGILTAGALPAGTPASGAVLNIAPPAGQVPPAPGGAAAPAAAGGRGGRGGSPIVAHENVLARLSAPTGKTAAAASDVWPTSTFYTLKKVLNYNDEAVEILHQPAAHTDGDAIVFFRKSDVVAAGAIINTLGYPVPDLERGGGIQGILDGLNKIIDITVPRFNQQGGTRVVPGRGRILNEADVVEYRDMMTIIRDRVQWGIDEKKTLAQIKAQRPTLDYDGLYSTPQFTGEMLIDVIYKDLTAKK